MTAFLQDEGKISEEVDDSLKKAAPQEIYGRLVEPITWETDSKEVSFVDKRLRYFELIA